MSEASKRFRKILKAIEEEEYERCSELACEYLDFWNIHASLDQSKPDSPTVERLYSAYANYFRLFAGAYRIWQVSYQYTDVRKNFNYAYYALRDELTEIFPSGLSDGQKILLGILEDLSAMLCSYVRCENAFISNDPLSLSYYAGKATMAGKKAKGKMYSRRRALRFDDPTLNDFRKCLGLFIRKGIFLHRGLEACANAYSPIFANEASADYCEQMRVARHCLKRLRVFSPELASELNAHIRIIDRHHADRQDSGRAKEGYVKVTEGVLVLAMSATCSDHWVRENIYGLQNIPKLNASDLREDRRKIGNFKRLLVSQFRKRFRPTFSDDYWNADDQNSPLENFRPLRLHDIFETAFGTYYLQNLAFNLPDVRVRLLRGRQFIFNTSVQLSTLGVCTVYFRLELNDVPDGLTVEEVRSLQSLICPHAGEARIDFVEQPGDGAISVDDAINISEFNYRRLRKHLANVLTALDKVRRDDDIFDEIECAKASIRMLCKHLDSRRARNLEEMEDPTTFEESFDFESVEHLSYVISSLEAFCQAKSRIIKADEKTRNVDADCRELARFRKSAIHLNSIVNTYPYLAKIAASYLDLIKVVFEKIVKGEREFHETDFDGNENWQFSQDTGWYTYLLATNIDLVRKADRLQAVNFDEIEQHRDIAGLRIEQREARASFDDWRFMNTSKVEGGENLAHIRSHDCDAFYGSEYQSFLYFPSDPMFLMEQYEETVKLMMRMSVMLKCYNALAYDLIKSIRNDLPKKRVRLRGKGKLRDLRKMEEYLRRIADLRLGAGEAVSLTANAGISRYKDHGLLMATITENMQLNKVVDSINAHLESLDILTRNIVSALEAEREKTLQRIATFLTFVFSAIAIDTLVKAYGEDWAKSGWKTIAAWVVISTGTALWLWKDMLAVGIRNRLSALKKTVS